MSPRCVDMPLRSLCTTSMTEAVGSMRREIKVDFSEDAGLIDQGGGATEANCLYGGVSAIVPTLLMLPSQSSTILQLSHCIRLPWRCGHPQTQMATPAAASSSAPPLTILQSLSSLFASTSTPAVALAHPYAPSASWKGKSREVVPTWEAQLGNLRDVRECLEAFRAVLGSSAGVSGTEESERARLFRGLKDV